MTAERYAELLDRAVVFARAADDVSCLAVIGSRSGTGELSDEFSDLDLLLVTRDVRRYYDGDAWLASIGDAWLSFHESVPEANFWERRAVFDGGLDVDLVLVDEATLLSEPERLPIVREICAGGLDVVLDKRSLAPRLESLARPRGAYTFPSAEEFSNLVSDFYFHCLWACKKSLRGEHWVASACVDGYLRRRLLSVMETRARSTRGKDCDTHYDGRYLERWAAPHELEALPRAFSSYGRESTLAAIRALEAVFTTSAREAAAGLGYAFPEGAHAKIVEWLARNAVDPASQELGPRR